MAVVTLKGVLEIARSGTGFVLMDEKDTDVLVRPGNFNTALNGDVVKVKVTKENPVTKKREGKITEVVTRKQTEFIGHIQLSTNFAFFVPDTEKPMPDFFIPLEKLNGAKHRDRVVAKLKEWGKDDKKPIGEVVSLFQGQADDNDTAMKEILIQAGFPLTFSDDALEDAARIPEHIPAEEILKRRDCRDVLTFTIDPVDAKDFDDAISIRKLKGDTYEIGVHIADVSHYVEPGTVLDEEAYKRATSVYLPDRVNPMLPERISNELCSLRPNEDKFTFSAIFQITEAGTIKQYWLGKTIIHSRHRFTYEEAQEVIEAGAGPYHTEILLLNKLAKHFRKERFDKGAINFSSTEVRFQLDEKGKPIGIVVKESKEAHQLIEEFMLLANKTVAEKVAKVGTGQKSIPFPYRVHDSPDEKKLLPFIEYAKRFGYSFDVSSPEKIAESFNKMLAEVNGKPEQHVLERLGIRTMAKAAYTTKNIGHYGLAFEYYCHFTSPIRRYPDVLVHRVLHGILMDKHEPDKKMEEKCKLSSERERAAMECERAGNKYKQVEFMQTHIGKEMECVISGAASFGFFVETIDHKCEGLISTVSLSAIDDFVYVEADYALVGRKSGRAFRIGANVVARLVSANLERKQLDFEWVDAAKASSVIRKPKKQEQNARPAVRPERPGTTLTKESEETAPGNKRRQDTEKREGRQSPKAERPARQRSVSVEKEVVPHITELAKTLQSLPEEKPVRKKKTAPKAENPAVQAAPKVVKPRAAKRGTTDKAAPKKPRKKTQDNPVDKKAGTDNTIE